MDRPARLPGRRHAGVHLRERVRDRRRRPANGTFLRGGKNGPRYRVVGGYAFPISNCKILRGRHDVVNVDPWTLAHAANPLAHLRKTPRNGTVIRCLPSRTYWSFKGRQATPRQSLPIRSQNQRQLNQELQDRMTRPATTGESTVYRTRTLMTPCNRRNATE